MHKEVAVNIHPLPVVPQEELGDVDSDHGPSRMASALRLLTLLVVVGLTAAFITAGLFFEMAHQLTAAGH
jgi:hypothetical protein